MDCIKLQLIGLFLHLNVCIGKIKITYMNLLSIVHCWLEDIYSKLVFTMISEFVLCCILYMFHKSVHIENKNIVN